MSTSGPEPRHHSKGFPAPSNPSSESDEHCSLQSIERSGFLLDYNLDYLNTAIPQIFARGSFPIECTEQTSERAAPSHSRGNASTSRPATRSKSLSPSRAQQRARLRMETREVGANTCIIGELRNLQSYWDGRFTALEQKVGDIIRERSLQDQYTAPQQRQQQRQEQQQRQQQHELAARNPGRDQTMNDSQGQPPRQEHHRRDTPRESTRRDTQTGTDADRLNEEWRTTEEEEGGDVQPESRQGECACAASAAALADVTSRLDRIAAMLEREQDAVPAYNGDRIASIDSGNPESNTELKTVEGAGRSRDAGRRGQRSRGQYGSQGGAGGGGGGGGGGDERAGEEEVRGDGRRLEALLRATEDTIIAKLNETNKDTAYMHQQLKMHIDGSSTSAEKASAERTHFLQALTRTDRVVQSLAPRMDQSLASFQSQNTTAIEQFRRNMTSALTRDEAETLISGSEEHLTRAIGGCHEQQLEEREATTRLVVREIGGVRSGVEEMLVQFVERLLADKADRESQVEKLIQSMHEFVEEKHSQMVEAICTATKAQVESSPRVLAVRLDRVKRDLFDMVAKESQLVRDVLHSRIDGGGAQRHVYTFDFYIDKFAKRMAVAMEEERVGEGWGDEEEGDGEVWRSNSRGTRTERAPNGQDGRGRREGGERGVEEGGDRLFSGLDTRVYSFPWYLPPMNTSLQGYVNFTKDGVLEVYLLNGRNSYEVGLVPALDRRVNCRVSAYDPDGGGIDVYHQGDSQDGDTGRRGGAGHEGRRGKAGKPRAPVEAPWVTWKEACIKTNDIIDGQVIGCISCQEVINQGLNECYNDGAVLLRYEIRVQ